ncbi:response regulator transcription factor [Hydromonas duriensis]|uniref:Winged helix family two component transcriptional regulator n=1 Tax=Hydromonas duriensis TaxID=1527608 RepID=A0A4R6YAN7_9BURK|nr:response regulator transcription factor [Hydromonas duriensis]TDR32551.1 winged helix family two component transcriptional regulator [Hydromonas duriensis]
MRLLLVEDDALLGEGLVDGLTEAGFLVDWLRDGQSAITALQTQQTFDVMVLDIGLPVKDGLQVLQWMRAQKMLLPVLLLTARDAIEDRVLGLNAGADDYLIKPFALTELVARLLVLLRRQAQQPTNVLMWRDFELDIAHQSVSQQGKGLALSAIEFRLMHILVANRPHHISRTQLEEKLYGWQVDIESNALDVHLSHLRKKLGADAIVNTRNLGWRMGDEQGESTQSETSHDPLV